LRGVDIQNRHRQEMLHQQRSHAEAGPKLHLFSDVTGSPWPWPSLFSHHMDSQVSRLLYTQDCRWLEKILAHYIDTINSVSFDSDTKLADICTQMEFVPLGYLFERILDVHGSCQLSPCWKFFLTVGWSSAHIVRKCQTSCLSHWCLPSVPSSADCWTCIVMVNVPGVANSVLTALF